MKKISISNENFLKLKEAAFNAYDRECCGILLGSRDDMRVVEVCPARNVSAVDKQNVHFLIHPLELLRLEKEAKERGLEVIGFYHSHPDYPAILSKEDEGYMIPGLVYLIVSVFRGKTITIKGYQKEGLEEHPFEITIDTKNTTY